MTSPNKNQQNADDDKRKLPSYYTLVCEIFYFQNILIYI